MKKLEICLKDHSEFLKTKSGQDFLAELVKSDDIAVLQSIAECPQATANILRMIVERLVITKDKWSDANAVYRTFTLIVKNKSADADILDTICDFLLSEKKLFICESRLSDCVLNTLRDLGRNPNAVESTLIKLLNSHYTVCASVATNISISDELLIQTVENNTDVSVRAAAAVQLAQRFKALKQAQTV